jgi:hypothetical protein
VQRHAVDSTPILGRGRLRVNPTTPGMRGESPGFEDTILVRVTNCEYNHGIVGDKTALAAAGRGG